MQVSTAHDRPDRGTGCPGLSDPAAAADLRLAALERQMAGLSAQLQLAEQQNLALETRVAGLAGEVKDLAAQAFAIRTLEEMFAARGLGYRQAGPPPRPRHLRAAGGTR